MLQGTGFLTVRRGLLAGIKNIVREPGWGTSLASLFGVLLLCQFLLFVMIGLEGGIRLLEEKTDLRIEILDTATDPQIQDLYQSLKAMSIVDDVLYITREQAMERMKQRDPELLTFLATFGVENPFPETMGVRLRNLADYDAFVRFLQQPIYAAVVNPNFLSTTTDQEAEVKKLLDATTTAHTIVLFVVGLLGIVLLFVIIELIRRRALAKREELFIQQLVGASRSTILLPFFAEIAVLLLAALFLALLTSTLLLFLLPIILPAFSTSGPFAEWMSHVRTVFYGSAVLLLLSQIFAIILLAFLGTSFALKDQFQSFLDPHSA